MPGKTKVLYNGQWVSATVVPVTQAQETWSEFLLADGSVFKVKIVVTEVAKIDDVYEKDGTPVYNAKWNAIVAVSAPEHLKKIPGV